VVMVWHVYRRQALLREVQGIHEKERLRLERQQLFLRLASHELRTPITVARGYTELVRAAHADDPALQQDTAVVIEELDKVAGIAQRLVTLMQLDQPHPLRRVDIDAELARIVRRWQPAAERHWEVGSAVGLVDINPDRFETALDCLLENAVKFTRRGDRVRIVAERFSGGWAVHVADSGCGIAPDIANRLMHADPGHATQTGTGLGLAIVRAVVEPLGGRIMIDSELGVGTVVTMRVPQIALQIRESRRPEVVVAEAVS